jgi:hypothetical protein
VVLAITSFSASAVLAPLEVLSERLQLQCRRNTKRSNPVEGSYIAVLEWSLVVCFFAAEVMRIGADRRSPTTANYVTMRASSPELVDMYSDQQKGET